MAPQTLFLNADTLLQQHSGLSSSLWIRGLQSQESRPTSGLTSVPKSQGVQ